MTSEDVAQAWEALRNKPEVSPTEVRELLSRMDETGFATLLFDILPNAPDLQRKVVEALVGGVDIFIVQQELESAEDLLKLAEMIGSVVQNDWALARAAYWRGALEMARGQPEAAIPYFEQAAAGAENTHEHVIALYNTGRAWHNAGKIRRAERQLEAALDVARADAYWEGVTECCLLLGIIARDKNQPAAATHWLEQARSAGKQAGAEHLEVRAIAELGIMHAINQDFAAAHAAYQTVEQYLARPSGAMPADHQVRAAAALSINQAKLALREAQFASAQSFAEAALKNQAQLPAVEQVDNLVSVGDVEIMAANLEAATRHLFEGFRLAEGISYLKGTFEAGSLLGFVYAGLGCYEPAHRVCAVAIDALEHLRREVGSESERMTYVQHKMDTYELMVQLCIILADLQRAPHFRTQGLTYTERARSRTLLEALGPTVSIMPPERLPAEIRQAEEGRLQQVQAAELRLRTAPTAVNRQAYEAAQIELNELWDQMARIVPEYTALRRGQPLHSEEIQALLSN